MNVDIKQIKPNPKNPRILKDDKFIKLVESIKSFPQMLEKRPLVCYTDVDGKYVVLGGNMRLRACQKVGLKTIPILLADDWTAEQRNEFIIKDNVSFGEWDYAMLANEWDAEELNEWGLDVPSFDTQDFSDKNQEINVDDFEDEMVLKLKFNKDDFIDIQERFNIAKERFKTESNEDTLKELFSFHERTR